ncbi:hypothetical protein F4803DRAFT_569083 [Xylaria telfairii]|nr:hypothetical protein F4803DRAFT_569083 [Xylaria telfairii]
MEGAVPDLHRVLRLPVEMQIKICSFLLLHSSIDLLSLIMSCRAMYDVFKNHRASVILPFLRQMDQGELVLATAHYQATIASWKCPEDFTTPAPRDQEDYTRKITDFCEKYVPRKSTELLVPLYEFTLAMVAHIQDIHLVIHNVATMLAPSCIRISNEWKGDWPAYGELVHEISCHISDRLAEDDYYDIDTLIQFIMRRGVKGLIEPIATGKLSENDIILMCCLESGDPRSEAIRGDIFPEDYMWVPFENTLIKTLEALDAYPGGIYDGVARLWLCRQLGMDIFYEITDEYLEGTNSCFFFDDNRLDKVIKGHLPPFTYLFGEYRTRLKSLNT